MKLTQTAALATLTCMTLHASVIYSGDTTGWNTYQPGASSSANSPNFDLTDAQAHLTLPNGVTPVSFDPTGVADQGQVIEFVDQWSLGQVSQLQWWSTGPTVIWINGGVGGIVVDDPSAGPHSGTINLSTLTAPLDYFAAFVTSQDCTIAFAYNGEVPQRTPSAPEPGTVFLAVVGVSVMVWRKSVGVACRR